MHDRNSPNKREKETPVLEEIYPIFNAKKIQSIAYQLKAI
jgi:hypothetical protein